MENAIVATGTSPEQGAVTSPNDDVLRCVESQEKRERLLPKAIYLVVMGIPVLMSIAKNGIGLETFLNVIVWFIGAKVVEILARGVFLEPSRAYRYGRAAKSLKARLEAKHGQSIRTFTWTLYAPGALALTPSGEVIVTDRSGGYRPIRITPAQIADVRVERKAELVTRTKHSGAAMIGMFSRSFAIGHILGGHSSSVTQTFEEFFLELRYQLEKNGKVATVVVPGGSDRQVVEELCATIRRMEA